MMHRRQILGTAVAAPLASMIPVQASPGLSEGAKEYMYRQFGRNHPTILYERPAWFTKDGIPTTPYEGFQKEMERLGLIAIVPGWINGFGTRVYAYTPEGLALRDNYRKSASFLNDFVK